jgi:hypothetical protein
MDIHIRMCILRRKSCISKNVYLKLRSYLFITCSFWTTWNLYGLRHRLFRRILWTFVCCICNCAPAREMDFSGLRVKACLTRTTTSLDLGRSVEYHFSALPVTLNCSYHLLMLLSTGDLTSYSHLNLGWSRIMDSNWCTTTLRLLLYGRHCTDRTEHAIKASVC